MSTIFFSISTHYRVPNITKIRQANYKKKTGINAYVQRAAIIVKKKKKKMRFPVEKREWIYVEGWIDKGDGSTDGS